MWSFAEPDRFRCATFFVHRLAVTILKKDNSPFLAYIVPISAEVNNILALHRDFMIPSAYYLGAKSRYNLPTAQARSDCAARVKGLRDQGTAFAFVGSSSTFPKLNQFDRKRSSFEPRTPWHFVGNCPVFQIPTSHRYIGTSICSGQPRSRLIT